MRNIIQKYTQHLFRKILDAGACQSLPNSVILDRESYLELKLAWTDLQKKNIELTPELQARLKFALGIGSHNNREIELAKQYYSESLEFWQQNNKLKQQACLLFCLGLLYRQKAVYSKESTSYSDNCKLAKENFQRCIHVLEQDERPDLLTNFIIALGEVLQRLKETSELKNIALRSIELYKIYPHPIKLAHTYGLLAYVFKEEEKWEFVRENAEKAIRILAEQECCSELDTSTVQSFNLDFAKRNYLGWYYALLAESLTHLDEKEEAIKNLEKIVFIDLKDKPDLDIEPRIYIALSKQLQELYREKKEYKKAFQLKRKQVSIEQQYGFRAFVGAGFLQPEFQQQGTEKISIVAREIEASGRSEALKQLRGKISNYRNKLTVIHGESGVGKSSLINAGLIPELKQQEFIRNKKIILPNIIRKYSANRWIIDLWESLKKRKFDGDRAKLSKQLCKDILEQIKKNTDSKFITIIIFDQLEDYFSSCQSKPDKQIFYNFLKEIFKIRSGVKIIFSIREESLHNLVKLENYLSLKDIGIDLLSHDIRYPIVNFSKDEAKLIIEALTERTKSPLESDLIEQLVEDLAHENEVSPIELQVVGKKLEEDRTTTIDEYHKLGSNSRDRIRELIKSWLDNAIEDCGEDNKEAALEILYQLTGAKQTTEKNVRTLKTKGELFNAVKKSRRIKTLSTRKVNFILEVLIGSGIIFTIWEDNEYYYQLIHGYLTTYIQESHREYFQEIQSIDRQIEQLISRLSYDDYFGKLNSIVELGKLNDIKVSNHLKNYLNKHKKHKIGIRYHIFHALAQLRDYEARELLIQKGLEDPEPVIRAHVARLLGQLHEKRAKVSLISKCNDDFDCVKIQAALAVNKLGESLPINESACQKQLNPLMAFVLIKGSGSASIRLKSLKRITKFINHKSLGVVEGGLIYGDYDVIVKVLAEDIESLNELVIRKIQSLKWVVSTRTLISINEPRIYYWRRCDKSIETKLVSYALIKTNVLGANSLISCLMDIDGVSEVTAVYGEYDAVAKIEVSKPEERDEILTSKIKRLPSVEIAHNYSVATSKNNSYWEESNNLNLYDEYCLENPNVLSSSLKSSDAI
ncbi:MAG: Lrp/AsnC ligand binding domain-containing protein [Pleurocapsa sp. MO_226.B13]|nr:Lrp/AsnC ligand binding domain-containing protein [Pleurocapsa sp. MO_226.B13]